MPAPELSPLVVRALRSFRQSVEGYTRLELYRLRFHLWELENQARLPDLAELEAGVVRATREALAPLVAELAEVVQ